MLLAENDEQTTKLKLIQSSSLRGLAPREAEIEQKRAQIDQIVRSAPENGTRTRFVHMWIYFETLQVDGYLVALLIAAGWQLADVCTVKTLDIYALTFWFRGCSLNVALHGDDVL